jgi:hypothetical protein
LDLRSVHLRIELTTPRPVAKKKKGRDNERQRKEGDFNDVHETILLIDEKLGLTCTPERTEEHDKNEKKQNKK